MYTIISFLIGCQFFDATFPQTPSLLITPAYIETTEQTIRDTVDLWSTQQYTEAEKQFADWMTTEFATVLEVIRSDEPETALRLESQCGQLYYQLSQHSDLTDRTRVQQFTFLLTEELHQRVVDVPMEEPAPSE